MASEIDSNILQLFSSMIVGPLSGLAGAWFIAWRLEKMYAKKDDTLTTVMQKQIDGLHSQNTHCHETNTMMQKHMFEIIREIGNVKRDVGIVQTQQGIPPFNQEPK